MLDDIAIAPVPLPAAGFGLMAALGGLAALRRRRRKA
ncbi:MAG: VPLPA-CTERM sorting domain-containing protein [Albidovulum sp.]